MQNKKSQSSVGQMIQRCHKWRQKRKQYMDQARQTADEIEPTRDPRDKTPTIPADDAMTSDDDDAGFADFVSNLK